MSDNCVTLAPLTVMCPCGTYIDIPISCAISMDEEGQQRLAFDPDYADLWAHAWAHDPNVNFEFHDPC